MHRGFAIAIVVHLLCAFTALAHAQSDSAEYHGPTLRVWGTVGLGAAHFDAGHVDNIFPPSLLEGWLALGPVGVALRRVDTGGGIKDDAWLLGARTALGPLLLVAGGGKAEVSSGSSNGQPMGAGVPTDTQRAWTAEGELSLTLGHHVAIGASTFRTGGTRVLSSGQFVVVEVGRLR